MATCLSIVVVEDHAGLRKVTAELLRQAGHLVTELGCAEDLGETTAARQVDLFIIDVGLPGEDGMALASRLRAAHPQTGIIIMTALNKAKDIANGFRNGADQFLMKPVHAEVLLGAVNVLGRRVRQQPAGTLKLWVNSSALSLEGAAGTTRLSMVELNLLTGLVRAPHQRLDLFQVAEILGQKEDEFNKASIEVRVARLRKKLIDHGAPVDCLRAIRHEGYQLCFDLPIC